MPDFAWSLTDAWLQLVGGIQPDGALRIYTDYDAPGSANANTAPVPAAFDYHPAAGSITNISGGPLQVRARAVLSGFSGDYANPSLSFCPANVVPNLAVSTEFAQAGAAQAALPGLQFQFTMVCEHVFTLANGDDLGIAFGWGAAGGAAPPSVRSLSVSYTVVP